MTKQCRILILSVLISIISIKGISQVSISYYSSSLSKIGVAYTFNDKLWSELRLYSNTSIDDITPELVVNYNISRKENHNIYLGLGVNVNYFNGIVVPIGIQFTPIEKFKNLALHIEFQPTIDFETDVLLQSSWGLRYRFEKKTGKR